MKERPILYQPEMVRATLDDRKSMTRRVIKPQPGAVLSRIENTNLWTYTLCEREWKCPYGILGDRLWVREIWARVKDRGDNGLGIVYRATTERKIRKWKPSIFMPYHCRRINLEITNIRVERVQDISEEDAIAEGIGHGFQMNAGWPDYRHIRNGICDLTQDTARMSFATLWDSINAKPKPVKRWPDLPADPGNIIAYVSFPWDESERDPRTEINGKPHYCYPNPWVWALTLWNCKALFNNQPSP